MMVFSLGITTLFKEAKRATQIGFMILFLVLIPYQIILEEKDDIWPYFTFCLVPGVACLKNIYQLLDVHKKATFYPNEYPIALSLMISFLLYLHLD